MTQFVKIPKQIIKNYPGAVLKVYGALESHCRKNKTFCYPGNKRLSKLTGIKTKATLVAAKAMLERDNWLKIIERKGKSNTYVLLQMNCAFKLIPIDALLLSNYAIKLYCILLYITHKEETETTLKNIKNISGIKEGRTIRKCMLELVDNNFVNITRFPTKYISNWKIHKTNVGIFEPLCGKNYTTMWEKLNYYVGKIEPEANYVEVRLIEANYVKQAKAENSNSLSQITDNTEYQILNTNTDTDNIPQITEDTNNPLPDLNTNIQHKEKENFVTETDLVNDSISDEDINNMSQEDWQKLIDAEQHKEPPKINRAKLRKDVGVYLANDYYYKYLDAKKVGFNGNAEVVKKYVMHEITLWDKSKYPKSDGELTEKFQKEMFVNHPVAQHFKNMTEEQRQKELEIANIRT